MNFYVSMFSLPEHKGPTPYQTSVKTLSDPPTPFLECHIALRLVSHQDI